MTPRLWKKFVLTLLLGFGLMQLVPYGRDHTNPPLGREPRWDTPATRALAVRACFDCHSHETKYPWYSSVAPGSWLMQHDVEDGRRHLNFSAWQRPQHHAEDAADAVESGEMPMLVYLPLHPEAKLSDADKAALVRGLSATIAADPPGRAPAAQVQP